MFHPIHRHNFRLRLEIINTALAIRGNCDRITKRIHKIVFINNHIIADYRRGQIVNGGFCLRSCIRISYCRNFGCYNPGFSNRGLRNGGNRVFRGDFPFLINHQILPALCDLFARGRYYIMVNRLFFAIVRFRIDRNGK